MQVCASNHAVFLSYASQDGESARRICEALRAAGVEVWFDQSELRGGDAWDGKIRKQIKECALFIPIISKNSQTRREGYFRIEWKLAAQRTQAFADGTPFVVPVVIDETSDATALVPEEFCAVQWTRLPDGETPPEFGRRIKVLLGDGVSVGHGRGAEKSSVEGGGHGGGGGGRAPIRPVRRNRIWRNVSFAVVLASVGLITWRIYPVRGQPGGGKASASGPRAEAQELANRALAVCEKSGYMREELEAAENMARRATERDPDSAGAWGALAMVQATFVLRTWDRTAQRMQQSESSARRALALDAAEPDGKIALCILWNAQGAYTNSQATAEEVLRVAPYSRRATMALTSALFGQGRYDEGRARLIRYLERDPNDVVIRYILGRSYVVGPGGASPANVTLALEQLDRATALHPLGGAVATKAVVHGCWRGDLIAMRAALDELEKLPPFERSEDMPLYWALYGGLLERKPERVLQVAALTTRPYLEHWDVSTPRAWALALAHKLAGQTVLERREWLAAEAVLTARLRESPNAVREQAQLAITLAQLGRHADAAAVWKAVGPLLGESNSRWQAYYYASLGDAVRAEPYLRAALNQMPHVTKHTLRYDPWWDALRGQPEFDRLLADAGGR